MISIKKILLGASMFSCLALPSMAGNKDRTGQAGAYELLINPFARSSGMGSINFASVKGIESTRMNVAGLSGLDESEKTELVFAKSLWLQLKGGGISLNDLGFSQKLGKSGGVLGVNIMSMGFGEIPITTTDVPDVVNGNSVLGTYKPQFLNLSICYSKKFSDAIQGGVGFTAISEQIPNAKAQGMALDAGIQYNASTSPKIAYRNLHFGISLRNIGTPLQFRGDGLSFLGTSQNGNYSQTQQMRSANFELPSQLNIGASFDHKSKDEQMRLTIAGAFISNSFTQDQLGLGAQFAYREQFIIHAGYRYEKNIFSSENRSNVYTGLSAGFTFEVPLRKDGTKFGIDYSYRTTNPFYGTHSLGVRISL